MLNVLSTDRLVLKDYMNQNIFSLVKCKICLNVLNEPYDCLCCNNTFCFSCINNFIIKTQKCPFGNKDDESEALTNLKPSCLSLNNFLFGLKFYCCYRTYGCMEESSYNNILNHEGCCSFADENPPNRKSSFVSFNPKYDYSDHYQDVKHTDKIDKIFEILQIMQYSLNTRNSNFTPTKEFNSETPHFRLSLNASNLNHHQQSGETIKDQSQNLTLNLQNEKILSELDYLNDKLTNLENNYETLMEKQENMMKKIIEEQLSIYFEKTKELTNGSSTIYSSTNNSLCNSVNTQLLPKPLLFNQKNTTSNNVKRIKIDTKIKDLNNSFNQTNPKPPFNTSPRIINKNNLKIKENEKKSRVENDDKKIFKSNNIMDQSFKTEPSEHNSVKNEESILTPLFENIFLEEFKKLQESFKSSCIHNEKLLDEIKTYFLETTLDSTNVFVQKFDEFINQLKLTPFKLNI